ncbi:hypothetical protein [Halorientalis halophila]|uniref:hypothetical protein n=1 Tax=Halorientalis halophila TaxID=3108499 RepID=UPI003008EB71
MSFGKEWHVLLENVEDLPSETVFTTPLSQKSFRVTAVQERRLLIEYRDGDDRVPLERDQFETLYERVTEAREGFGLDRLPPNAEPYATVLSLHPHIELDDQGGNLIETETASPSPLVDTHHEEDQTKSTTEPSIKAMMDNMGNPADKVNCPIEGCDYSHRSASSVARHVSGSSTDKHIWANTSYEGWRDFVRKHS